MASYQALIGQIMSPICPHCGSGEEVAEHSLPEHQRHFGDNIYVKDLFQHHVNLIKFLISSGHLPPHIGTAQWTSS